MCQIFCYLNGVVGAEWGDGREAVARTSCGMSFEILSSETFAVGSEDTRRICLEASCGEPGGVDWEEEFGLPGVFGEAQFRRTQKIISP